MAMVGIWCAMLGWCGAIIFRLWYQIFGVAEVDGFFDVLVV